MDLSVQMSQPRPWLISSRASSVLRLAIYTVLGAATLSPLLWVRIPPLADYPNHLARIWILTQAGHIPELARNYMAHWRLLPDLGADVILVGLAQIMSVEAAGRVFVALSMLSLVSGTAVLHRVLYGRIGLWPVCCFLFLYNAVLFWGFLSCLFGFGAYLWAFSAWIASRDWKPLPRILTFAAVASLLVVLHLFAFGLYGLSVATYELARRLQGSRLSRESVASALLLSLQFLPGMLLWYASVRGGGLPVTQWGDLGDKRYALVAPGAFGIDVTLFDYAWLYVVCGFLLFAIAARALKIVPEMRLPLAAMVVIAVLMPFRLSGSSLADIRLPVVLPFVFIASTRFETSRKAAASLLAALAISVLGVRVWTVTESWRDYDHWFGEFRSAAKVITPGARLFVVEARVPPIARPLPGVPLALAVRQEYAFQHIAALAVMDRSAFEPCMFTEWVPIDVAPRNREVAQGQGSPITPEQLFASLDPVRRKTLDTAPNDYGELPYWRNWPEMFDYVLWIDFAHAPKPKLAQLQPVAAGSYFEIYRVLRD